VSSAVRHAQLARIEKDAHPWEVACDDVMISRTSLGAPSHVVAIYSLFAVACLVNAPQALRKEPP